MHVYEQALEAAGVPTYVIGGRGYWSHPQVIELVAYLRALANPRDAEALHTVRLSPLCGLSLDGLVLSGADARDELSLDDRMRSEISRPGSSESAEPPPGLVPRSCSTVRFRATATSFTWPACPMPAGAWPTCAS